MDSRSVKIWLQQKVRTELVLKFLSAISLFLLAPVILYISYWAGYVLLGLSIGIFFEPSERVMSWLSILFLVVLFIEHARVSREYLSELSFSTGTASGKVVSFYVPGLGMSSNINPIAPDTLRSSAKLITDILFTGPRVVMLGIRCFRSAFGLMKIDTDGCSKVIALLLNEENKVPFEEVVSKLPEINFEKVFTDLRLIKGVMFLVNKPQGLALESTLKKEIMA